MHDILTKYISETSYPSIKRGVHQVQYNVRDTMFEVFETGVFNSERHDIPKNYTDPYGISGNTCWEWNYSLSPIMHYSES